MNKDVAKNICTQMIEDVECLCECPRYNEKDKTCIGCRELAIKTILEENINLQQKIDKAIEYIENGDLLYLASKCSIIYRDNIEVVGVYDRLKDLLEILKSEE